MFLVWSTNAYKAADLSLNLPCEAFTNHYRRGEGQGHEWIVGVDVALREFSAAGEAGPPTDRNMGMLAQIEGLETALLEGARQLARFDPVVRREVVGTDPYFDSPLVLLSLVLSC